MPLVGLDVYSLPDPLLPSPPLATAAAIASGALATAYTTISIMLALQQQTAVGFPGPPQKAARDGSDVFELIVVDGAGRRYLRVSTDWAVHEHQCLLTHIKKKKKLVLKRATRLLKRSSLGWS